MKIQIFWITSLLYILSLSTLVMGADVAPLYFENLGELTEDNHVSHQEQWDSLMKFKLWGTNGFEVVSQGQQFYMEETVGYTGTGDGDFSVGVSMFHLGGPVSVSGNASYTHLYDVQMLGGPFRTSGNLTLPAWKQQDLNRTDIPVIFDGPYCVKGAVTGNSGDYDNTIELWKTKVSGGTFIGDDEYENCPESVPPVYSELSVPKLAIPSDVVWEGSIDLSSGGDLYVHIPPDSLVPGDLYDKYVSEITTGSVAAWNLYVLMQPEGRKTRIFIRDSVKITNSATNGAKIRVVYVSSGTTFNKNTNQWDLSDKVSFNYIDDKSYAGNLMFYTDKKIFWNSMANPDFQGTFISTDTIEIKHSYNFAGQLIAKYLKFWPPFEGDFTYVPFDPPWIDFGDPEATSWGTVYEGESYTEAQKLKFSLSKTPTTSIEFKYCFEFAGDQSNTKRSAPDVFTASVEDLDSVTQVLECSKTEDVYDSLSTNYKVAKVLAGSTKLLEDIAVTVANDKLEENVEEFYIRIFDLSGAVLQNNKRFGTYSISIVDDDIAPIGKDTTFTGYKDSLLVFSEFPAYSADGKTALEAYSIVIISLPNSGTLSFNGKTVNVNDTIPSSDFATFTFLAGTHETGSPYATFDYVLLNSYGVAAVNKDFYTATINIKEINHAPVIDDISVTDVAEDVIPGKDAIVAKLFVTDVDDDTLTYTLKDDFGKFGIDSLTGVVYVKDTLDYETDSLYALSVIVSDGDTLFNKEVTFDVHVVDVNEAPVAENTTFNVEENVDKGTAVGTVLAEDPDLYENYNTLTYTLEDSTIFSVGFSTGVITVKDPVLDYETDSLYVITVTISDGKNEIVVYDTVRIINVNEAPVIDNVDLVIVPENANTEFVAGNVIAHDVDSEKLFYTLSDSSVFKIKDDGSITLRTVVDFETKDSYDLTVYVSDGALKDSSTITIKIADVNEEPAIENQIFEIAENNAKDESVGEVIASDPDVKSDTFGSSTLIYTMTNSSGLFAIDSLTGEITVKEANVLDYESVDKYVLTVRVTDGEGSYKEALITILVTNVNEAPVVTDGNFEVDENTPQGTIVCVVDAIDPDKDDLTYKIVGGNDDDLFTIDDSGNITVLNDIDFENLDDSVYTLKIEVSDGTEVVPTIYIITVKDVNEAPTIANAEFTIARSASNGSAVGSVLAIDPDAKDSGNLVYSIVTAGVPFTIDERTGDITVKGVNPFLNSSVLSYTFNVSVHDMDNASATAKVTVKIKNIKPEIQDISIEITESCTAASCGVIDTVVATDADGDTLKCYLEDSSNTFYIDSLTCEIFMNPNADLNYEKDSSLIITVIASDNIDSTIFKIPVSVKDANEPAVIVTKTLSIHENASVGTKTIESIKIYDEDTAPAYTVYWYEAIAGDTSKFAIDKETGSVSLRSGTLDYENGDTLYTLTVVLHDGAFVDTANITIKVLDVYEASVVSVYKVTSEGKLQTPDSNGVYNINKSFADIVWKLVPYTGKTTFPDTSITGLADGCYEFTKTDDDKTINNPGKSIVTICVNTQLPVVSIRLVESDKAELSGVTLVEELNMDFAENYVNTPVSTLVMSVTDPVKDTSYSYTSNVTLGTASVKNTASAIEKLTHVQDDFRVIVPADSAVEISYENGKTLRSWTQTVNGQKVRVKQVVECISEGIYEPVLNENGYESVSISVDYSTTIQIVTALGDTTSASVTASVSYEADALTGHPITNDDGESSYQVKYVDPNATKNELLEIAYTVDSKGNAVKTSDLDVAYEVFFTYTDVYGNTTTNSITVTLDITLPVVKITYPFKGDVIKAVSTTVKWTVDGVSQDSLNTERLEVGVHSIIRTYRDKAGNEASDTVKVTVKKAKSVDVAMVEPVVVADEALVLEAERYYAENPSAEGSHYSISVLNPVTGNRDEVANENCNDCSSYTASEKDKLIGPTLQINLALPSVSSTGGLATVDDMLQTVNGKTGILIDKNGNLMSGTSTGADGAGVMDVDEYVENHCNDSYQVSYASSKNISGISLYHVEYSMHVWVFTNLGNFVEDYTIKLSLDDELLVDEAGLLTMYFTLTPDKTGALRSKEGKYLGTGAYLMKTEIKSIARLNCDLPGYESNKSKYSKNSKTKNTEDNMTSFGYRHPKLK